MSDPTAGDHPGTDPGNGKTQCGTCGKWVWLVTHSCKGVRVYPDAPGVADDPRGPNFTGGPTMRTGPGPATPDAGDASEALSEWVPRWKRNLDSDTEAEKAEDDVWALADELCTTWHDNDGEHEGETVGLSGWLTSRWACQDCYDTACTMVDTNWLAAAATRARAEALREAARDLPGLDTIRTHGDAANWLRARADSPNTPARTIPTTATVRAGLAADTAADNKVRWNRALKGGA